MGRLNWKSSLVVVLVASNLASEAMADVPWTLNFSGRLGSDVGDYTGSTDLTFTLYDDATSQDQANILWTDTMLVQVDEGRFQVLLGSIGNPLPSDAFVGPDLYLGIQIDADPEMTPRIQVASVPWAIRAGDAATLGGQEPSGFSPADHDHDDQYVNEGQAGSVTTGMVVDRTLLLEDLGDSGCGDQQVAKWNTTTNAWECADDVNTFNEYTGADFATSLQQCEGTNKVMGIDDTGKLMCSPDVDTDTTYAAGTGLTLTSGTFSLDQATVTSWAQLACYDTPEELHGTLDGRYSPLSHQHDDLYYAKSAVDTALVGKSDTTHNHDTAYVGHGEADSVTSAMVDFNYAGSSSKGGPATSADQLDGHLANATGVPVADTIPVTGADGKIPADLLPFNQGDLLAPADRPLVEGLAKYLTDYFHIDELGIQGSVASNVKNGVRFGPDGQLEGNLREHDDFAWWADPQNHCIYDDFETIQVSPARWSLSSGPGLDMVVGVQNNLFPGQGHGLSIKVQGENNNGSGTVETNSLPEGRHVTAMYRLSASVCDNQVTLYVSGQNASCQVDRAHAEGGSGCSGSFDSSEGALFVRSRPDSLYDIYRNTSIVCSGIDIGPNISLRVETFKPSNTTGFETAIIDTILVSSVSPTDSSWIKCDDNNECTHDYLVSGGCVHESAAGNCDDSNACTENDTCSAGTCGGTTVDCDDSNPYTADDCDATVGCTYSTCPVSSYSFDTDSDEWTLGAEWLWDDSGWLQGTTGSGGALSPPLVFPETFSRLRFQYKCKGSGKMTLIPGSVDVPCASINEWEVTDFINLGASSAQVKVVYSGDQSVLLDWVELLEPCP